MKLLDKLIILFIMFFGYIALFNLLPMVELPQKESPYQKYYENDSVKSGFHGGTYVEKVGVDEKVSYTIRRKTLFGYVEVNNNKFPYFFDMVLLPRQVFGITFSLLHTWYLRVVALLTALTLIMEVIKK